MTTIAFNQYCNISFIGGSYASTPLMFALTSPSRPNDTQARIVGNNGIQNSKHSNPPKFGVSDDTSSFAMGRKQYTGNDMDAPAVRDTYADASDRMRRLKSIALGSATILKDGQQLTYKSYNANDVKCALGKVRGHGSVAPAKKGAIENTYASVCTPKRGFLPPNNTSVNSVGSKHSAFMSRHALARLECPSMDENSQTNNCPGSDPANIEGATYSAFPTKHNTINRNSRTSTLPNKPDMKISIFTPHYLRQRIACNDDCPSYEPTVIAGEAIVVDANKFSTSLPNHIKSRIGCGDCLTQS